MKSISLTHGKCTIVDDDLFDYLNQWDWWFSGGYAVGRVNGNRTCISMHRLILDTPPGMDTDHINRNGLDNRRSNLRICDKSQNQANRPKQSNNSSGYKGVDWHKRDKKWRAKIKYRGKYMFIGYFDNPEAAAEAYYKKASELFGEFANTGRE